MASFDPPASYYDSSIGGVAPVDLDAMSNSSSQSDEIYPFETPPVVAERHEASVSPTSSVASSLPHHLSELQRRSLEESTNSETINNSTRGTGSSKRSISSQRSDPPIGNEPSISQASRVVLSGTSGPTFKSQVTPGTTTTTSPLVCVEGVAVVPPSPEPQRTPSTTWTRREATSSPSADIPMAPFEPQQQQQQPRSQMTTSEETEDDTFDEHEMQPAIASDSKEKSGNANETVGTDVDLRFKRLVAGLGLVVTLAIAGAVVAGVLVYNRKSDASAGKTLETIERRGRLLCGILSDGGKVVETEGTSLVGFSIDLCKALAGSLFQSSTDKFTLVPVGTSDRFVALNNRSVDVLIGSATHTMERQVCEPTTGKGYSFSVPYLYGGLTFGGVPPFGACADSLKTSDNQTTGVDCSGMSVCVVDGTTFARDVPKVLQGDYTLKVMPSMNDFYDNFMRGICNVLAGDQFEIAPSTVKEMGYFGDYQVGNNFYSKEPLAMVTRHDDSTWSDFVNWMVQGLIGAEEQGITQSRANSFEQLDAFGEKYKYMFIDAIEEGGHYGELYETRLEGIVPRKTVNTINKGESGTGLLYAMPFGSTDAEGPAPVVGSTLYEIRERGFLRCGINRGIFSILNTTTKEYTGFDVDFCRALSAAIFGGVTATIVYSDLNSVDRFAALAKGEVDVLSRITTVTLIRDVLEPTSQVGFSFSQPNFYDGVLFGGIPPFGACANAQDTGGTTNQDCASLKICVDEGTTTIDIIKSLFPEKFIVPRQSSELVVQGLKQGVCNAIAGGVGEVVESNVREVGQYNGPYEIGSRLFSKDPLALVTRQDDFQWSAFVYWIVSGIVYAEERSITSASSPEMPIVNLFGYLYSRMLREAVAAVGSYHEIYNRNLQSVLPRTGLNLQNTNPLGPQHYPLPGLGE